MLSEIGSRCQIWIRMALENGKAEHNDIVNDSVQKHPCGGVTDPIFVCV